MLRLPTILALCLIFASSSAWAEGQFIDIYPKSAEEISLILDAVDEQLLNPPAEPVPPIIMMLHGKEAERFLKSHYAQNQSLVDQSARLSAFGLIDVKICETWLRRNNHGLDELFPFIGTVPYGAGELERLEQDEGYVEFALDL